MDRARITQRTPVFERAKTKPGRGGELAESELFFDLAGDNQEGEHADTSKRERTVLADSVLGNEGAEIESRVMASRFGSGRGSDCDCHLFNLEGLENKISWVKCEPATRIVGCLRGLRDGLVG